ncbi:hypothetical protein EJA70_28880 [Pseudomonas sp. PB103]|uniref:hypothetical protein n=1 Tax=Pseudomonas sp. PB103 TaxID=2494698 RepID=UPI00131A99BC|nr:hypothetical protein [Pseudomonas sp. PB103]KAE9639275.1 hypothetical protein EJA70_28880 [Pseudomonas sp. PB103]
MRAIVEKKAADNKLVNGKRKHVGGELSDLQLRRIREALVNPIIEEPGGVLAGASFTFSS